MSSVANFIKLYTPTSKVVSYLSTIKSSYKPVKNKKIEAITIR